MEAIPIKPKEREGSLIGNLEMAIADVRVQMGHSSIQVTVDIYGHLVPGSNKQAVDKLDEVGQIRNFPQPEMPPDFPLSKPIDLWRAWRDLNPRPADSKSFPGRYSWIATASY